MAMDSTNVNVKAEQPAVTREAPKSKATEEVGFFAKIIGEKAAEWTAPTDPSLYGIDIKPINGTWSGLLTDMARYLVVDKAELGVNKPLISNVSNIVRQVLLTIGTIQASANQPVELNDPAFIKHLTANLLKIFLVHQLELSKFDPEADPTSPDGKALRKELGALFNDLLVSAGLDESNKEKLPYAIQQLLYPGTLATAAQGLYRFFNPTQVGTVEVPAINREGLEEMFVDGAINMLVIQKKLAEKSQDPILNENEGVTKLVDKLVKKKILKKLRSGELNFTYDFLKSKKNSAFLNGILNQALSQPEKGSADSQEVQEAWGMIENQLKMALKGILAVVLTPKEEQTPVDRRNTLLISLLDRLNENSGALSKKMKTINGMDKAKLEWGLTAIQAAKGPYEERASALLERINTPAENVSWESEARQLLKQREYTAIAQTVLKNELDPEKFKDFIPKLFKPQDLFEQIYEFVGETALEFHEQQQALEVMGKEALSFITHSSIPKLSTFVEEVLEAGTATIEEQAQKNKIELGYGAFLNEMICHLLKEESVDPKGSESEEDVKNQPKGSQLAKQEVKSLVKNVLMISIKKAIESNTHEKCTQAEAFSSLTNHFVKNTITGLEGISEKCKALKEKPLSEKKAAVVKLAAELGIENLKNESADDTLLQQYRSLLVKSLSRELIKHLMPKDLFTSLLPPMLRKSDLWESVTDEMVAPYIEGISVTLETFQAASIADSKEAKQLKLNNVNEEPHPLQPLIQQIAGKAIDFVSDMKLSKLLKQEEGGKLDKVNFEVLDELFGKAFKQGGEIPRLIQSVFPPFIESILALKLNPKDDKHTSQELATELIWNLLEKTHACYERIDVIRADKRDLEMLKSAFQLDNKFDAAKIKQVVEEYCEYCTEKKIKHDPSTTLENKEFYVWMNIHQEMKGTLKELMDDLISEEMWNLYVPKQFKKIIARDKVGDMLLDYLKEGYDHSVNMKKMVAEGKTHLPPGAADQKDKPHQASLQEFIEEKVLKGLTKASVPAKEDEASTQWMKGVLAKLLEKQKQGPNQFITKFSVNLTYSVLGKLLSGGIPSFIQPPKENAGDKPIDATQQFVFGLMKKVSKLIPQTHKAFLNLNNLNEGQKCSLFPQITAENIKAHLSLGKGSLNDDESIENLPVKFERAGDDILFKVSIKDSKKGTTRDVSINATRFVYWGVAYQTMNRLISDEDWKELIPELMQSVLTKAAMAEFAIPYIQAGHQIQEPLQRKAESGQARIEALAVEDPDGKLQAFMDKNVIGKIHEALDEMGNSPKKVVKESFPEAIDMLAKAVLREDTNTHIAELKSVVIERVVYLLSDVLLKPAAGGRTGTDLSAENVISKASALVQTYLKSKNATAEQLKTLPREIAQQVLDEVLPPSVWEEIFVGELKNMISREEIVDTIEEKIKEIFYSIDVVKGKQSRAMERIKVLDQKAGLIDGRGGGLEEMVKTICKSIDETLDEFALQKEKIFEDQPLLLNAMAQEAFKDKPVSEAIKSSAHALITICISRLFQSEPGKEAERLLEVMTNLFDAYDPKNPKATAVAWLKELLPEKPKDLLKEIVPPFLHETLTHDFLADLLVDYVKEVKETVNTLKAVPNRDAEIQTLQKFIKDTLGKHKDPAFARDGLAGFGGFVKSLETAVVGTLAGDPEWKKYEKLSKTLEGFLDNSVAKVMNGARMTKLRDKPFLAKAMVNVLPLFGNVDIAKDLPGFPTLSESQLADLPPEGVKKAGVALVRMRGENDEAFKQRLSNKHFEQQCGKLACESAFPNGAADLPLPKVARPAAFTKVQEAIGDQVGRLVNRNERILFAIDFLEVEESDKKEFHALEDHVKAKGALAGKEEKSAERLFKKGLVSFAMKKVKENVAVGWPNPFKWLAVKFTQALVKVSLKLAINKQVWNLISDPKNDQKFRFAIWKFLSFAKSYEPVKKDEKEEKELSKDLKRAFRAGFREMGLLGGIRPTAASGVAGFLMGKNFVDLIA